MLLRAGFEAKGRARHGVVMRHIDGRRVVVPLHLGGTANKRRKQGSLSQ